MMCWRKSENTFGISVKNTPTNANRISVKNLLLTILLMLKYYRQNTV